MFFKNLTRLQGSGNVLSMNTKLTFKDLYSFPGFRANARLRAHPEHTGAMVVTLNRRQKKRFALAEKHTASGMTAAVGLCAISIPAMRQCTWNSKSAGLNAAVAEP